jgi:hypothetical protein
MKSLRNTLALCGLLGIAGMTIAQVKMPDPTIPGGSPATAVRLVAPSELMIDRQIRRWLRTHYPGWSADHHEIQEMGVERYAVVRITADNQPMRRVYFRLISSPSDPEGREGGSLPF